MAGLLQIIIWMGCVYLILKGVSILQVGMASSNTNRGPLIAVGYAALAVAIIAAFFFARVSGEQTAMLMSVADRF